MKNRPHLLFAFYSRWSQPSRLGNCLREHTERNHAPFEVNEVNGTLMLAHQALLLDVRQTFDQRIRKKVGRFVDQKRSRNPVSTEQVARRNQVRSAHCHSQRLELSALCVRASLFWAARCRFLRIREHSAFLHDGDGGFLEFGQVRARGH